LGLGNYSSFTPSAHLHANLLSISTSNGNLFRTDGHQNQTLTWSMFSGTTVANSLLKARLYLSPNTQTQSGLFLTNMTNDARNHIVIESTRGDIVMNAAGANENGTTGAIGERMRITSDFIVDPHWSAQPRQATRVGISGRPGILDIVEPLAMLHIGDQWSYEVGGHRRWMNTGTYLQRRSDNTFFGMRHREGTNTFGGDQNDAIIAWGDNDSPANRLDALRFVFCAPYSSTALVGSAEHLNGLEIMRVHPEGNIGMGDFSLNGLNETPTEKLDIVGNVRIREIPFDTIPSVLITGVQQNAVGDYDLNYLAFPDDSTLFLAGDGTWQPGSGMGGEDMDWEFDANNVWTGHGLNGFPGGDVSIGTVPGNNARLTVIDTAFVSFRAGQIIRVNTTPTALGIIRGLDSEIFGPFGNQIIAVNGLARSGKLAIGGRFTSILDTQQGEYCAGAAGYSFGAVADDGHDVIGIYGYAENAFGGQRPIGVYGEAISGGSIAGTLAGHFAGNVQAFQPFITLSDETIKTNINPIENSTDILMALNPVNYSYNFQETFGFSAGDELSHGFLAQEVQEVFPTAVTPFYQPARYDTAGTLLHESVELLGIRYDEFIPLLVAGFKTQQGVISAQSAEIAAQTAEIELKNQELEVLQNQLAIQDAKIQAMEEKMIAFDTKIAAFQQKTQNCCQQENQGGQGFEPTQKDMPSPMELG
jgi:hypothetical protein